MFLENLRVVFDTGVIVSHIICPGSTPSRAYALAKRDMAFLFSDATIDELAAVLLRPKFSRYLSGEDVIDIIGDITQDAEMIATTAAIRACRDPKDDMFLELAVSGGAQYIVTGDDDLLLLHPFQGIHILTPNDFIEHLNKAKT